jgi:hypothetical protein
MKRRSLLLLALAATLAVLSGLAIAPLAGANPKDAPAGERLAFSFNYIAVPNGSASCGQGHRVFSPLSANGNIAGQHILWTYVAGGGIGIDDCLTEGFDGDVAEIHADLQGTYTVYVVLLGPNVSTNTLRICRNAGAADTHLCELGDITLGRGGGTTRYSFPSKLFDLGAVNELWHLEQGTNFRIAQVRLYAPR